MQEKGPCAPIFQRFISRFSRETVLQHPDCPPICIESHALRLRSHPRSHPCDGFLPKTFLLASNCLHEPQTTQRMSRRRKAARKDCLVNPECRQGRRLLSTLRQDLTTRQAKDNGPNEHALLRTKDRRSPLAVSSATITNNAEYEQRACRNKVKLELDAAQPRT